MSATPAPALKYLQHPHISSLQNWLLKPNAPIHIKGLSGSAPALLITALQDNHPHLIVAQDKESAAYLYHDLVQINQEKDVYFLPSSYKRSPEFGQPESSQLILRTEALQQLRHAKARQFFITYTEALLEKVPGSSVIENQTLTISKNEQIDLFFVVDFLKELGFKKADFVYEPGYYSVRGSILDIYSFSHEEPFRIDFFGDEIESIRSFDIEKQLSKISYDEVTIIPELVATGSVDYWPLTQSLTENLVIWMDSPAMIQARMNAIYEKVIERNAAGKSEELQELKIPEAGQLVNGDLLMQHLEGKPLIILNTTQGFMPAQTLQFNTAPQPLFHKNFDMVEANIVERQQEGYQILILSDNNRQLERLRQIFKDRGDKIHYDELQHALHEGFVDHDLKLCIYTDHQIFDRYHKFSLKTDKSRSARQSISIKELTRLNPGDFVVHVDHGIGRFGGLVTVNENGHKQELIQLVYRDSDILLVNIHSLHRISKYKGQEGEPPKVHKLGHAAWSKMKEKTKKKVKDIARELIALYAQRKAEPGFAFSPDSYLQTELEASFIYEDTPDQVKATMAVKQDMEEKNPMDRLVCGDVGFGKTEIAIRAAFKAVTDNKQVAILVPTTILALQHYHTFRERLADFPVRIEHVSRLRKSGDVKQVLKDTLAGKVNILIGTHRLIGKDVEFKDMGLLIIDEEQRFGVAVKEKLKRLKINVDTLTLTATPIPRTLQFSLMGARDLSILNTPPANRHPIFTELHTFNPEVIKEAILYEVQRNGQVFFINNRVHNILEIEQLLNRLLPDIKTVVAHGQMDGAALEKIMFDFINGDFDVLIATTIIESGLDIPNANTIIINNAHQFGLSELHQLRGRVGRSNKKAFCYLLAPPLNTLTNDARRRLKILEEFSDLGSGFQIAMQDLDIRGAGNLLGGEQSGFIADIGYETYQRILEEALLELRESEYPELIKENTHQLHENVRFVSDCQIETDIDVRLPENYISNIAERMDLYRELDNIKEFSSLEAFHKNLEDRFGALPHEALSLLNIVRIRINAQQLGIEKLFYKNKQIRINFVSNQSSPFYQSATFSHVLQWLQRNQKSAKMEEKNSKLWLSIPKVNKMDDILPILTDMLGVETTPAE
jgi:transcription-repair coupling factor (superfamily II helicase)